MPDATTGETGRMLTGSAQRAEALRGRHQVVTVAELLRAGATRSRVRANLDAKRWRRCGRAVVLHAGTLTRAERWRVALLNAHPTSLLTAFTAAEFLGLTGWDRPEIHLVAPPGSDIRRVAGLPVRLHRPTGWPVRRWKSSRCEHPAPALVRATGVLDSPRAACGLLAASVQQRLVTPGQLRAALHTATRARHRPLLQQAVADIEGGSQALSEIDFARICRKAGLPLPDRQTVRRDSYGRRRYLDATWRRRDGRLVVVEVDGALHLNVRRWWDDQLRQNELSLADALVLRFPSVVVREAPELVVGQLRQALMV